MRESCGENEANSIAYAESVVASYGFRDPAVLRQRSRRAHRSWQYLQYDYGLLMTADMLAYLQAGVASGQRIDAFLLQACGMFNAENDKASVEQLKACLRDRKGGEDDNAP